MKTLTKLELRKSRLKVLAEIDRLDKLRCDFCSNEIVGNSYEEKSKCDCSAAVEIRGLGDQLMKLVSKQKVKEVELDPIAELPPMPNIEGLTINELSVEIYKQLKLWKMTDAQIKRKIRVGNDKFHKWKSDNRLSHKTKERK